MEQSAADFRARAHALVDRIADAYHASRTRATPAIPYQSPEASYAYWRDFDGGVEEMLAEALARSTKVHDPRYVAHQVAAPAPEAVLASWLSDYLNNGAAVYEMGMAAMAIEQRVVEELAAGLGLPAGTTGIFTSGGSLANLTALLAARQTLAPDAPAESLCVLASDQAHYCIERAVRIMGWGTAGFVALDTDDRYRVTAPALDAGLAEARARGRQPIALVGMACSTSTGSYDDLALLGAFAKTHGLWFHVDGAHGAAAGFSDSERHLVAGIERADSIVLDAHKMMQTPALTTVLLYRDVAASYRAFAQRADYLWGEAGPEWFHSGQRTLECTKLMMGMRVFAVLRERGLGGIGAYVSSRHALARAFAKTLHARAGWALALDPQSNIVCFRHEPKGLSDPEALDRLNAAIRERLLHAGDYYLVNTRLRGRYWLRVTLMNPQTTLDDLNGLLDCAESLAAALTECDAATGTSLV